MANIILKDKNGNDAIFEGVSSVSFRTVDGNSVKFSEGGNNEVIEEYDGAVTIKSEE